MRRCIAVMLLAWGDVAASQSGVAASNGRDTVTFARDIAPLLQRHCQDCHRPGQAAPMSLLTYAETRPWAKSIQDKVVSREMPPFHAAGPIGRYVNDPRLSVSEIELVNRWVASGAPLGDPADLPAPRTWNDSEWGGGKPDLVVTMPKFEIRSDGIDDNVDLYSEYVFPEDLWLRAVEVRPLTRSAMHHANVFLTREDDTIPDTLISREMRSDLLSRFLLLQWLPGRSFETMPEGQAILVLAGRRIMLNTHYAPGTEPRIDEPRIGLYFADGRVDTIKKTMAFMSLAGLKPIPPYDPDYRHRMRKTFDADALVTDFHFHMHYRGRSAKVEFELPDGTMLAGIEVPRYDFSWQRTYELAKPISIPKGTTAYVSLQWDNSAGNPLNPDPAQPVKFGWLTTNEMGAASIGYYDEGSKVETPILVRNGRRVSGN